LSSWVTVICFAIDPLKFVVWTLALMLAAFPGGTTSSNEATVQPQPGFAERMWSGAFPVLR
jgi:hypothetical protein